MERHELKLVDMNDYELVGGGAFSFSYVHRTDRSIMAKFARDKKFMEGMTQEFDMAAIAYDSGIPTPEPVGMITDGEQTGLVFKMLPDKKSFAKAICDEPERIPFLAGIYANAIKKLHSTEFTGKGVCGIKEQYAGKVARNTFRSEEIKKNALAFLEARPDASTCLHGDLHFGNVVLSEGNPYFIDMGNFTYGHPMLDMGMMPALLLFGKINRNGFIAEYHCTPEQAESFWHCVLKDYFGKDTDIAGKEHELIPYSALRILSAETETCAPFPGVLPEDFFNCLTV